MKAQKVEKKMDDKRGGILFEFAAIPDMPEVYEQATSIAGKTPKETAEHIIDIFNDVEKVRYGKKARLRKVHDVRLVEIKKEKQNTKAPHQWRKSTAMTVIRGGRSYDKMYCVVCGITGKRHTLGGSVISDGRKYCQIRS